MNLLTILSPLSAWLVMLSLGLGADHSQESDWRREARPRHWIGIYLLPLALLVAWTQAGGLSHAAAIGFVLCVLSGSGTSGVAWARAQGAEGHRITARLASGALVSLVAMPLAASLGAVSASPARVGLTVFVALVLAQWLPWQLGRWWRDWRPLAPQQLAALERLASLSVVALIVAVAWQALPQLARQPMLVATGAALATLLGAASVWEATDKLEAMGVVRNLTVVTLVLMQSGAQGEAMAALAAFGAVMYPAAWLATRAGATLRQHRAIARST